MAEQTAKTLHDIASLIRQPELKQPVEEATPTVDEVTPDEGNSEDEVVDEVEEVVEDDQDDSDEEEIVAENETSEENSTTTSL